MKKKPYEMFSEILSEVLGVVLFVIMFFVCIELYFHVTGG